MYLFAKCIKSLKPHLKVVICGEGADELFGGYTEWIRSFRKEVDPLLLEELNGSLLYNDYKGVPGNIKDTCDFFLKHQLVAKHLNPFNICFQNFLMEIRCPFLDWNIYRFMQSLVESEFEDKKIIKDLASHLYHFEVKDYKKYGLPQLFNHKIIFRRRRV
jgi:asparagine synthetase B (glutamine-hydrolysing)